MKALKNMKTWRKVLLIILSVLVLLRIGYVAFLGDVDKEYYTSAQYDLSDGMPVSCGDTIQLFSSTEDRLDSLEVMFSNIAEDKQGAVDIQIFSGDDLLYQSKLSLVAVNNMEWKKVPINTDLEKGKTYKIAFIPSECTQIPNLLITNNGSEAKEIQKTICFGQTIDGQAAINYGYLRAPSFVDRISVIAFWLVVWIFLSAILIYFEKIYVRIAVYFEFLSQRVKPQIMVTALELLGCFMIINCSGIEFQEPTQVLLYLVSLVGSIQYASKSEFVHELAPKGWKRALLVLLYIYAGFALVGQRTLIYPLSLKVMPAGLFIWICAIFWFVPIINSAMYYLEKMRTTWFAKEKRFATWQFVLFSVVLLILPAVFNLIAKNPGMSSLDTVECMIHQAQHLHGSGDWHPAFYCMVLRAIESVWNSTYAVIIVQYFFWTYVCVELMLYLRKKGIREWILIALTLLLGINTGNYMLLNTIWKDIPYALSLFWAIIILAKLLIDYEEYKGKWYIYLELIVALIGISLYRKNGIVPFFIILVFLVIILRKNVKVWIAAGISLLLFGVIKGPVYSYFEIEPVESGIYIGLSQDILGAYYSGGEVSEDTLKMITVMTEKNILEHNYNPTWSWQSYDLDVDMMEFLGNYINTFVRNPVLMTRAIIDREDALWDIYPGENTLLGCVNYSDTMDHLAAYPEWNENYPARQFVSIGEVDSEISNYTASTQWIVALEWRSGLFSLLGLIAALFIFFKKKKWRYILLLTPALGQILSLLLSTGWSEFRYFWPLNLLNFALILLAVAVTKEEEKVADVETCDLEYCLEEGEGRSSLSTHEEV